MSDCKGCKYWTQAIDDYANGKHTDKEPNPFCSTCEGDKYQPRGAKETKASLVAKINALTAENEALKAKVTKLEAKNQLMRETLELINDETLSGGGLILRIKPSKAVSDERA